MAPLKDESRMLRKQYHLSVMHVRRLESLRRSLGVSSDAEVIRQAIDAFDPEGLAPEERQMLEDAAASMSARIRQLSADLDDTIERARAIHTRIDDPEWIESVRERTRREAEVDPALVNGVAQLVGAAT